MNKRFTYTMTVFMPALLAGSLIILAGCKKEEVTLLAEANNLPQLVINEFMASNSSGFPDPVTGEYDDWIEIYNKGNKSVNLAGLYLSDNKTNKSKFKIPATNAGLTTIQPGGYLILWADSQMEQGELHLDFKLSADGEDLGIYTGAGQTIDETTFGSQTTDISTGRLPSAYTTWTTFAHPTPGTVNK